MKKRLYRINSIFYEDGLAKIQKFSTFNFQIAREIRKKYDVDETLFSINGNVVFINNQAVRIFVKNINDVRPPENNVKVGEVNAAGLLDEIYHYLFRLYEIQVNPGVVTKALNYLNTNIGEDNTRKLLFDFISIFPPMEIYRGKVSSFDYLNSYTADRSNVEITLEEMMLLAIANINPANKNILELFDQNYLSEKEIFGKSISALEDFFKNEKTFGPENQDLLTFFKTPILQNPDNIEAQLEFIREKWGILLDEKFLTRILSSKDLIKEDYTILHFGGGGAPMFAPQYKGQISDSELLTLGKSGYKYALDSWKDYDEPENFTRDIDWMPNVIMIAKNSYVWLDQLSKKYQRHIKTLDQIPDEELDQLAQHGINGLWLIGIWERSNASKKIKHILGNIDAVASAYSLYDYQIAWDLGGEYAYNNLNERARKRGIRLASDMVPNHTGIFSKWVVEHPDYFIQSPYPPFPNYRFTGTDLSDDPSVALRIEDGYWSRSDAAVVFQRIDNRTGETRYIYHGNDGTNMPWNDTAQLNMIRADVREAVIQKIFEVARKFSIIRFDAAMTLAKKHFSRLWYPAPGRGGDIPSRADCAMSQNEFDQLFPKEFWREVVDRINAEMPETLLLAEAFWLMEGYFVRTLGMHRVYNSAFMHMMMKEENAKYRDLISNTLEFEPEILKRYVNFMSNPDEETAIKQFGTDDKYFGVCTLMVTLPGLPMFAHGQIEGYTEKYGMEYQRAYYHEIQNQWLVDRHVREIFPLAKRRYLFSNVTNFWLFDFIDDLGSTNENVFAYTNGEFGERALIFYNNKYQYTSGKIFRSSLKLINKEPKTVTLAEALSINSSPNHYYVFREHVSNLEYLKSGKDFARNGFHIELNAFKYLVYLDFREVYDDEGDYEKLIKKLQGRGVPSISRALTEMKLEPVHSAFEQMFDEESLEGFIKTCVLDGDEKKRKEDKAIFIDKKFRRLLKNVNNHFGFDNGSKEILNRFDNRIITVKKLNNILEKDFQVDNNRLHHELHKAIVTSADTNYNENSVLFIMWLIISGIEGMAIRNDSIDELLLDTPIRNILRRLGRGDAEVYNELLLLNCLRETSKITDDIFDSTVEKDLRTKQVSYGKLVAILEKPVIKNFIGVNEYEGIIYYSKENFEELLNWLFSLYLIYKIDGPNNKLEGDKHSTEKIVFIKDSFEKYRKVKRLSDESGYRYENFIDKLNNN
ncbi:MAG: alpha-amylase family glycosyl hydrolase [Bacteroidota bacterium]